jgi:HKD family nuclease
MISHLKNELKPILQEAQEIYIASALISYSGYQFISDNLSNTCRRHYIVGIHLPTNPIVLEKLLQSESTGNVQARVFNKKRTYHPKVYIIKTADNTLCAFIGSANTTEGGFCNNIEMTTRVDNPEHCRSLLSWFSELYAQSAPITTSLIENYKKVFKKLRSRAASDRSDIDQLLNDFSPREAPANPDFTNQFFQEPHFNAYRENLWSNYSSEANAERKLVKDKLMEIHEAIYPRFDEFGMTDLSCHYHRQNITSLHYYNSRNNSTLDAMWLHYGYSKQELLSTSFLDHPRIQIILREDHIGIWLVVGKDYGSHVERLRLKNLLEQSPAFVQLLYTETLNLGGSYSIDIDKNSLRVSEIESIETLRHFLDRDSPENYFIFGRKYNPDHPSLSKDVIFETILLEFQRLYPLYRLIQAFS